LNNRNGGKMASIDQQFIEYIVKSLVSHPDDVIVERNIDEKGVLLVLTVNPEDLGRVIGRRGVTAQSLRTLLRALGTKNDARYNLKIINNDGRGEESQPPREASVVSDVTSTGSSDPATSVKTEDLTDRPVEKANELAEKTRQELAELDDLDI
jgi:predicted RNA-binding protein YlqC (UPF0109 family)